MGVSSWLRRFAWATLVANVALVVTGGAVRLTGSGLGCPTWPRCNGGSFTPHGTIGPHQLIEFGNRTLTFVLVAIAVATFVAARQSGRRDLLRLSVVLGLAIPAQAVLGGITVLTDLNPWVVSFHLLLSLAIVSVAVLFLHRLDHPPTPTRPGHGARARLDDVRRHLARPLRRHRRDRLGPARRRRELAAQRAGPAAAQPAPRRPGLPADRPHGRDVVRAACDRRRHPPGHGPRRRRGGAGDAWASCSTSPGSRSRS